MNNYIRRILQVKNMQKHKDKTENNMGKYGCYTVDEVYQKGREDAIYEELQSFAQWLWDSHYLVDEAFTIRLVEQYKDEQLKEQK